MTWTRPGFEAVARLVGKRTGLVFAHSLRDTVEQRIVRAMAQRSITDLAGYHGILISDESAFEELVTELTVGETYFFRESEQLEFIRARVIPELVQSQPTGDGLRAWSAGCASGEEAYTLAILLRELGVKPTATVLGTDLSKERLERACGARYSRWSLRGVPQEVVHRYFQRQGDRYQLTPEVKEAVKFRQLNLAEECYPSLATGVWGMDLILCRNVLIYLDPETVAGVARRLMRSLSARGWLFLGASDPPLTDLVECQVVVTGAGVAYRHAPRPGRRKRELERVPVPRDPVRHAEPGPVPGSFVSSPPEAPRPVEPAEVAAHYAARDYARTSELAREGVEREPGSAALWVLRVRALANQGMLREAGRVCTSALEHHPMNAELMYLHGLLLAAADHPAEAVAAVRRALYLDQRLVVAHLALGTFLLRLGDRPGARTAFRNAVRLLEQASPDEVQTAADGQTAGGLLGSARMQLRLLMEVE